MTYQTPCRCARRQARSGRGHALPVCCSAADRVKTVSLNSWPLCRHNEHPNFDGRCQHHLHLSDLWNSTSADCRSRWMSLHGSKLPRAARDSRQESTCSAEHDDVQACLSLWHATQVCVQIHINKHQEIHLSLFFKDSLLFRLGWVLQRNNISTILTTIFHVNLRYSEWQTFLWTKQSINQSINQSTVVMTWC